MEEKKKLQASIAQRIMRLSPEDEIYLGELAQGFLNSEMGVLLEATCNGLADEILSDLSKVDTATKAATKLGLASAYRNVIKNLERLVVRKEQLLTPIDIVEEEETEVSTVPNPRLYKGMRGIV